MSDDQNTGASASASSPSNKYSGLISLKIDWFGLLAVPRDSQESSLASQFEGINSLALCLLYGPAPTTIHDHWEDHRLDYMYHCWQSNISAFQHAVWVCHGFPAKKQSSSDFMAAVTICSDFRAEEEEICHNFHHFPFYFP